MLTLRKKTQFEHLSSWVILFSLTIRKFFCIIELWPAVYSHLKKEWTSKKFAKPAF